MTQNLNIWNGSSWNSAKGYVWDGTTWQNCNGYFWTGSAWQQFLSKIGNNNIVTNGKYTNGSQYTYYGYSSSIGIGSVSPSTVPILSGAAIINLYWEQIVVPGKTDPTTTDEVFLTVSGILPNSGWTTLTIGTTTFSRTAASYSTSSTSTTWLWKDTDGGINNPFGTTVGAAITCVVA